MPEDAALPEAIQQLAPEPPAHTSFLDFLDQTIPEPPAEGTTAATPPEKVAETIVAPEKTAATPTTEKTADQLIEEAEAGIAKGTMPRAPQWAAVKEKAAAAAKEVTDLRKQLDELKSVKPVEDPEKAVLKQELDAIKKEHEIYEKEIKAVRVEASKEFNETVNVPARNIFAAANALAARASVDPKALIDAMITGDPKARNALLSELSEGMNRFDQNELDHLTRGYLEVAQRREHLRANAEQAAAELESKHASEAIQQKAAKLGTWKTEAQKARVALETKLPMLKDLIPESAAIFESVAAADPEAVTPLEQSYSAMAGKILPAFVNRVRALEKELAEGKTALSKYQQATPGAGGAAGLGSSSTSNSSTDPSDGRSFLEVLGASAG